MEFHRRVIGNGAGRTQLLPTVEGLGFRQELIRTVNTTKVVHLSPVSTLYRSVVSVQVSSFMDVHRSFKRKRIPQQWPRAQPKRFIAHDVPRKTHPESVGHLPYYQARHR